MDLSYNQAIPDEESTLELEIGRLIFKLGNTLDRPYFEVQFDLQRLDALYRRLMQLRAARQ